MKAEELVEEVCKKIGIEEKMLQQKGEEILMDMYLKFENCVTLSDAYNYLTIVDNLITIAEEKHLFPIPLNNIQNKTKRKIFFPNIKFDIKNSLYALKNIFNFSNITEKPIKQTDLIKALGNNLDKGRIQNGLWFLSEYGLLKRWNEKNKIWIQFKNNINKLEER